MNGSSISQFMFLKFYVDFSDKNDLNEVGNEVRCQLVVIVVVEVDDRGIGFDGESGVGDV